MTDKELRELDAWIAEHVMGWNQVEKIGMVEHGRFHYRPSIGEVFILKQGNTVQYFHPTTDPAAAMMVLEKCGEKCGTIKIVTIGLMKWVNDNQKSCEGKADTLPLAIALFAKKLHAQEKETKVH